MRSKRALTLLFCAATAAASTVANRASAGISIAAPGEGSSSAPTMVATPAVSPAASLPAGETFKDPGAGNVWLEANSADGKLYLVGHDSNINSYEVDSAAGKLTFQSTKNHGGYATLTEQTAINSLPGSSNPTEDSWSIISTQAGTFVAEAYPPGDSPKYDTIGSGMQVFDLNESGLSAWTANTALSDLSFKYGDGTGATLTPAVVDITPVPEPAGLALLAVGGASLLARRRMSRRSLALH